MLPPVKRCDGRSSVAVLLSRVPTPARSPLFPYTTLFRSLPKLREPGGGVAAIVSRTLHTFGVGESTIGERLGELMARDRKSTRLNSSHRCMSYAVFCLKKKSRMSSARQGFSRNRRITHRP